MQWTSGRARFARMVISSLVAGLLGIGSNLLTALNASGTIPKGTLLIALITGGMLTLKDIQAYLSTPPTTSAS